MAGPLRRRIVAVLALAIGFGVVTAAGTAQAAPSSSHVTVQVSKVQPDDWWW